MLSVKYHIVFIVKVDVCFINAHDIILVLCVLVKNCIEKPYHIFCSGFSLLHSAEKSGRPCLNWFPSVF